MKFILARILAENFYSIGSPQSFYMLHNVNGGVDPNIQIILVSSTKTQLLQTIKINFTRKLILVYLLNLMWGILCVEEQHTSDKQQQQILLLADQYTLQCVSPEIKDISVKMYMQVEFLKVNSNTEKHKKGCQSVTDFSLQWLFKI